MNGEKISKHYIPRCQVRLVRDGTITSDRKKIRTPEDAYQILKRYFEDLPNEHFVALLLNTKNHVIAFSPVSTGSLNASVVHPRELFQRAILGNCAAVIMSHNHPSGDPTPSPEDIELSRKLCEAGKIIDIPIVDHIIVGDAGQYLSFKEKGLI